MTIRRLGRLGIERSKHGIVVAALLALTACAQYTLVNGDKRVEVGNAFSVAPQVAWTRIANPVGAGKTENWTIDGPLLHIVRFYKGIEDGDPLEEHKDKAGKPVETMPKFSKDMSPIEISELFETTLTQAGAQQFDMQRVRPVQFAGTSGFRFDYSFVTESGLKRTGFAAGTVRDGKLYIISYFATSLHYFDKHKDVVERLLGSAQLI